ncbi:MAG TPA: hypothetical protein VGA79_12310 [Desulfobaccales bacterium]
MKIRGSFRDDFRNAAFRYTMWLAILGFAVIVGVAALSTTAS